MREDVFIIKAICTFLIIVEHSGCPKFISPIIDVITLIPFAISSGMVFKVEKYKAYRFIDFVWSKFMTIYVPYLLFLFPGVLYEILKSHTLDNILFVIKNCFLIVDIPVNAPLWYLGTFFYVNIIVFLVLKISSFFKNNDKTVIGVAIVFFMLISYFLSKNGIVNLPFKLESAVIISAFMLIGILIRPFIDFLIKDIINNKLSYCKSIVLILFLVLCVYLIYINTYYNNNEMSMWLNIIGNPLIYYFSGTVITIYFYLFVNIIMKFYRIPNLIISFGKNSLYIYCLHAYLIILFNKSLPLLGISYMSIIGRIIKYVFVPIVLYLIVTLIQGIYNNKKCI